MHALYVPVRLAAVVLTVTLATGCMSVGGETAVVTAEPSRSAAGQRAGDAPDGGPDRDGGAPGASDGRRVEKHGSWEEPGERARGARPSASAGGAEGGGGARKPTAEVSGGPGRAAGTGSGAPEPVVSGGEPEPTGPATEPTPTPEPETPPAEEPSPAEPSSSAHEPEPQLLRRAEAPLPSPEAGAPV